MIINNKQVNLWRGSDVPPTIYHVWIYGDSQLRLYNGTEWITFIDDIYTIQQINLLTQRVVNVEQDISNLKNNTINGKKISINPVLNGEDIIIGENSQFINDTDTLTDALIKIDTLLNTQIIE